MHALLELAAAMMLFAPPADSAGGSVESGRQLSERGESQDRDKWIYRYAPTRGMAELGVYGGLWFPNRRIELFEPTEGLPNDGQQPFRRLVPEIGLRAGYYPFRFFGAEIDIDGDDL